MNVLLVMFDSLRVDHLAVNGHPVIRTPNFDRFAQEGTVFARNYAEFPITIPSRTAFFCGTYTFTNRPWSPLRPHDTPLAEVLQRAGYQTGLITDSPTGQSMWNMGRGFETFTYFTEGPCHAPVVEGRQADFGPYSVVEADVADRESARRFLGNTRINRQWSMETHGCYSPDIMTRAAEKWFDGYDGRRPFFLVLDYFDPHEPWDPPEPYMSMYDPDYAGKRYAMPTQPEIDYLTPEELQQVRHLYMGKVTQVDDQLPALWKKLDERGLSDDTLVVILSDHGEMLGEHNQMRKFGVPLYDELATCVMMMRLPGTVPVGKRVTGLTQNIDLMPTLLDLLEVDERPQADGLSLRPILEDKADKVR
ncbi:MAG: sulfatase, partial [Planctomycetes bacterium]|nr:sulfatase [Planctomycetota bacterium]